MHENLSIVQRIGAALRAGSVRDAADALEPDVVWHYFNPNLPELAGDHVGVAGIEEFFARVAKRTNGTFILEPISAQEMGDELVVAHGRLALVIDDQAIRTDVVVVWRLRHRRVVEVWDIPAVHTGQHPRN